MERKSFIATAIATLFSPVLSFASDGAILYDVSNNVQMTLTPSFSTSIWSDQTVEGDKGFEKINPTLCYELEAGVEGAITSKSLGPDYKLLFGATTKISDDSGLLFKLHEKDFTDPSTAKVDFKEVYVGIGSLYGNIKYGQLNKNPDASIVDLFGEAAVYGRFDDNLSRIVRYESPDIKGVTFTLSKGKTQRTRGFKNIAEGNGTAKYSAEELYLGDKDAEDYNLDFYAATANYQLGDFALKYAGSFTKNGITADSSDSIKEKNAFSHRFEGSYTKNDLSVGLGYQYAQTNTGWGTELDWHTGISKNADGAPTFDGPEAAQGFFDKKTYKTHELIASTSYTIGKFVPTAVFAYGLSGKAKEDDTNSQAFPAYFQSTVGVNYNFSEQTAASFLITKFNRIDDKDGPELTDAKHFLVGISHTF